MRALTIIVICWILISPVFAQQQVATPTPGIQTTVVSQQNTAPVPVPEPSEKAQSYYRSGIAIWLLSTIWGWLILALFLFTGFSARIRNWAQRLGKKWFFVIGIYFALFTIISFVIDFPLSYYVSYAREHAYGLSNQTFGKWFGDSLKGLMISLIVGFLTAWVPFLLLKKSPRRWWLYTGLLAIPFLIFFILITPIWIDPLFNDFGQMKDKALEAKILNLAERAGIEGGRVFEVNKSVDTKALNAYVTGFGNTKRIVLWDTTISKLDENELLFVMGHEMGHYVLGHVWKSILFFSLLIIITLYAIHRTAGWLIKKYHHRFGFNQLSDVASLPLIILLFSIYFFIVTPIALTFTRYNEHESDRFGLEITRNNHDAATAFVKLQTENLGVPRPHWLVRLWRASHPTLGERIDFCNEYRPWERGEQLKYAHLFQEK
ncbi:MAG: M48 family metallopeptidase [Acidobacteria bacterium]|nr:M48 family metallopeptidase [Acidobacteriota bacterium]